MEKTRPMSFVALTEEKQELNNILLTFLCRWEQLDTDDIEIIDIIPVSRGLKVIYKTTKSQDQKWARTIKYKDLANFS